MTEFNFRPVKDYIQHRNVARNGISSILWPDLNNRVYHFPTVLFHNFSLYPFILVAPDTPNWDCQSPTGSRQWKVWNFY